MTGGTLSGWQVLIGRAAGRSAGLLRLLADLGAAVQAVPLIDIEPMPDPADLDRMVLDLSDGAAEWVAFTSVNAVRAVLDRATALGVRPVIAADTRVAAVGPATADALHAAGIAVDLVPGGRGSAEALVDIFPTARVGETLLLPRSQSADDALPEAMRGRGFEIRSADAYRTVSHPLPGSVVEDLIAGVFQAVVVTSGSGVPALLAATPAVGTMMLAIGRPTAVALGRAGFHDVVIAPEPTDDGIITALLAARSRRADDHIQHPGGFRR